MKINEFIAHRRAELGLTQLDLAYMIKVTPATISRWETGDIDNMKRDKIVKLAEALQVSPLELLEDDIPSERVGINPDYYRLSPESKAAVDLMVQALINKQ